MALSIRFRSNAGEFARSINGIGEPIAAAATGAMRDAADIIKRDARAEMLAGGMSSRFTNTFRADAYPKGGRQSINAAAHAYSKIPYAGVFEEGARISGQPLLWLPIEGRVPPGTRPRNFRGRLVTIRRLNGPPLLGAPIGDNGRLVPVFVGVPNVDIEKKFSVARVMQSTANKIESLYAKNLKV